MEVALRESKDSLSGHQVLSGLRALQLRLRSERLPDFSLAGPETFEARKYLRVVRPAPFLVRLMDRRFSCGQESHCDYFPYTSGLEEQIRLAGERVGVVEISYRLRAESY